MIEIVQNKKSRPEKVGIFKYKNSVIVFASYAVA